MRPVLLLLLLALPATARELDLDGIVSKVGKRTSNRILKLARELEGEELHAAAAACYRAVQEFDPDNAFARSKLGYRRQKGRWYLDPKLAKEVAELKDADPKLAAERLAALETIREEYTRELIRVCVKYGDLEERRRVLEPLLLTMPRRADLHEALKHVKIGDNYARPGLIAMVRAMPLRLQAWRGIAEESVRVRASVLTTPLPGIEENPKFFVAAGCEVGSSLGDSLAMAGSVARTQLLLDHLLGEEARTWKPPTVVFLDSKSYAALVRALHQDEETVKFYLRFGNYEHANFYAIRVYSEADAPERYAHVAGYLTMFDLAAPDRAGTQERDRHAYAWLLEGFGYLVSLELFDRGYISFVSVEETAAKSANRTPPPAKKTRDACLAWVREEIVQGRAYPLREVVSRSLNNLDFCASMQAYTFVRFLFLYDPKAAAKLPAALRAETIGPPTMRLDKVLKAHFGKGLDDLEPLWRAFSVEIR
jgi:hypothetical protein